MKWLLVKALATAAAISSVRSFSLGRASSFSSTALLSKQKINDDNVVIKPPNSRRSFITTVSTTLSYIIIPISSANAASVPVQQAVGSAESKCREEGNCLENFELDGGTFIIDVCVCCVLYAIPTSSSLQLYYRVTTEHGLIHILCLSPLLMHSGWLELGRHRTLRCTRGFMRTRWQITR